MKDYKYKIEQVKSLLQLRKIEAEGKEQQLKIEKTAAGAQLYFGKIEALQPKKAPKIDKSATGTPLFEQQPEDKSQINLFEDTNSSRNAAKNKPNK